MTRSGSNLLRFLAAVLGALGVINGASSAHGPFHDFLVAQGRMDFWQTGQLYQWLHTLALLAASYDPTLQPRRVPAFALCWLLGIICFSGSLYIISVAPTWRWVGPFTPLGGLLLICGWVLLAWKTRPI